MILSLDLGTSKICAAVVNVETGRPVAIRSRANDTDIAGLEVGLHEQNPLRTRELCFDLIRAVLRDRAVAGKEIDAIGISGQMHGVLLVDADLRPLTNLITWRDRRTAEVSASGNLGESLALLDYESEERAGCRLATGYGAATLRWLDRNGLLPEDCTALTIAGFIAASLTGALSIDETHAASWGVLDVADRRWDEDIISRLGIRRELLPEITPSGNTLGRAVCELDIPGPAVVCSPVGDCQASVIGCAGFSPDSIVLNLGTGGQISVPSADCEYTSALDVWPLPFGGYLQLGAALCGGWSYAYLRQFLQQVARQVCGIELSDDVIYERMNSLAASAKPGSGGLVFDTHFAGTRKDKGARGAITGIDTNNLTPNNLCLSVLEGIVQDLHSMWLTSKAQTANRLIASGNAVRRNPVLRSVIGRAFKLDCYTSSLPEEAVRGAAYTAAVGVGLVSRERVSNMAREFAEPLG